MKYTDDAPAATLIDEKKRQERLEEAGFGVARIAPRDVRNTMLLQQRIARASQRGQIVRAASETSGCVGPRPPWARRGALIPWQKAPTTGQLPVLRQMRPLAGPKAAD